MTTFLFTPSCCCGSTSHECGENYGLQTFTSTSMQAFSLFMQGWNGTSFDGLRGDPGDPWFQTFVFEDGSFEYRSGVYLPNGMIDPQEARIYMQDLEGIILAGFQNCRRINFYNDECEVVWEPFSQITLNSDLGSYGILPDENGHRYLYYNVSKENLGLLSPVDLAPLIRDQDPNHHGNVPVAVTKQPGGQVVFYYDSDGNHPATPTKPFSSSNNPFYTNLDSYLKREGYYWHLTDYPFGSSITEDPFFRPSPVCDFTVTNNTEITLQPDQGFINWGGDFMLYYRWTFGAQGHVELDNNDLTSFLTSYNSSPTYLPDLTTTTPGSDVDVYNFGINFWAKVRVDTWWATY